MSAISKYKKQATSRNVMPPATIVAKGEPEEENDEDGKVKAI